MENSQGIKSKQSLPSCKYSDIHFISSSPQDSLNTQLVFLVNLFRAPFKQDERKSFLNIYAGQISTIAIAVFNIRTTLRENARHALTRPTKSLLFIIYYNQTSHPTPYELTALAFIEFRGRRTPLASSLGKQRSS